MLEISLFYYRGFIVIYTDLTFIEIEFVGICKNESHTLLLKYIVYFTKLISKIIDNNITMNEYCRVQKKYVISII